MIGKTISHYKIIEKIGEGGMGIVFKAQDLKLDRYVALKFLPPHMGKDEKQKLRFINEAKAVSTLDHPNICTIYEIDESDTYQEEVSSGRMFIAMAYYKGQTLEDKITEAAPIPVEEAISIVLQIAQGLNEAHKKDIVHRDIKPANIILPDDADIKIVDFGLAKLKGQPNLTKQESTLGTITYMSPEQAEGLDLDSRTDIWSLGIILYELLTGKTPFVADYEQAVIYNIINSSPKPMSELNYEVPKEIDDVILKCLEKDRENRYQSLQEFNSDLLEAVRKYKYAVKTRSGEFHAINLKPTENRKIPLLATIGASIAALIILLTILFWPTSEYTDYEEAYFSQYFEEVKAICIDNRTLEDIKANRYFLLSTAALNQDTLPHTIKQEFRNLYIQNNNSPLTHYYLGLSYFISPANRAQKDSVWIMYDEAEQLGMNSIYLNLDQLIFYKARGYNQQATEMVELLLEKYPQNPEVLYEIGSHFYNASDTSSAKKYFQRSLNLYADYVSAHISLFKIELGKNNDYSAKLSLDKANEINSENIQVVSEKTKFFIKENKLEEAEEYLKSIIDGFGKNEIRYYQILAQLYQTQDLFKKCSELIPIARDISPNDPYFANLKQSLQMRKEWLQIEDKQKNDQHLVRWSDDFEESLARAARENKPVFAEFYSTDQSWNKDFSTRIYPDPKIQELLKSYVPLKVNGDLEIDLVYKYGVTWYPAIVILNDLGEILTPVRYFQFFPDISEITSELERGLGLYNKYVEGKSLKEQEITEVSNIDDALVLSNSKNLPVMVVVYSKESEWSQKLLNETFSSPLIQAELRNVVLVKVDQANNKRLVRDRNITYFPSILFLDSNGKLIYQIKGYQQPKFLAKLISEINYSMIHNQPYKDRVNWFYDLEEAKFIAAVQKKDIFTFVNADWCPYCLVMINNVFTDPLVINTLNTTFIPLELDHRYDAEQVNSIGVRGFPTLVILNPEQEEIFRISGVVDVSELLTALELERRKPIYAALGRDKYHEFYNFESLASQFLHNRFYRSAIHAAKNQITIYPEYWQSYFTIAESYRRLNNPAKMLEYSALALEKGAEIDQTFAESVLKVYSQLSDMRGYEEWLQRLIESRENNKEELSLLYILYSDYYEIMQDNNAALSMAEKAVSIYPENAEGYIRLGRLHYLENNQSVAKSHLIKGAKLDTIDPRIDFYLGLIAGRNSNFKEKQRYFNQAIQKSEKTAEKVGWRVKYTSLQGYNLYPGYLNLIEQSYRDMLELYNLTNTTERLEIINDFAYFLGKEKRKLAEALQLVNQTLQEKPDNNNFLHTKAVICFQLSQYDKAHELVRKYEDSIQRFELERNPAFAYYLGRIKWAAGDKVKAKYYFDFILKPKEYFADTIRYQNEVKSLIGVYGNN